MDASSPGVSKPRVLFVCSGNTCRSVLAEYIARRKFGRVIEASSAGLRPGTVEDADNAIYTLKNLIGVDASGHHPRDVRVVDVLAFDIVVAMTAQIGRDVHALFPTLPAERLVKWQIQDPYGDNLAQYERCARLIHEQLKKLPMARGSSSVQ